MTTFNAVFARLPYGWLTKPEAKLLWNAAMIARGNIVEIGSHHGRSAVLLASTGFPLLCIDPWPDDADYAVFLKNTEGMKVLSFRKRVEDVDPMKAELVYIDGDHGEEATRFAAEWALKCEPKYIAAHDVGGGSSDGVRVERALLSVLGEPNYRAGNLATWRVE